MALCCETGGYERRAGMSLGDKTIIILNLFHVLKADHADMLSDTFVSHIETMSSCLKTKQKNQQTVYYS